MIKGYEYSMANFPVPEMAVSPPEIPDNDYDRNCRNTSRQDAIDAIGSLEVALSDLVTDDWNDEKEWGHQNTLKYLDELRDYLERDMED